MCQRKKAICQAKKRESLLQSMCDKDSVPGKQGEVKTQSHSQVNKVKTGTPALTAYYWIRNFEIREFGKFLNSSQSGMNLSVQVNPYRAEGIYKQGSQITQG